VPQLEGVGAGRDLGRFSFNVIDSDRKSRGRKSMDLASTCCAAITETAYPHSDSRRDEGEGQLGLGT